MPAWHPDQYLQFEQERTRPCRDLVARISIDQARTAIDLGCGAGNSTAVIAERWPLARITGLDSSAAMLERASRTGPQHEWIEGEIEQWAASSNAEYDIVLSNAALQWVEDHRDIFPKLLAHVRSGGVLALQMPSNKDATANRTMRELASSKAWRDHFASNGVREWSVHEPAFYYDVLASSAKTLELWETEYIQVMPNVESVAEWYKGTGMRPYLDALLNDEDRAKFVGDYVEAIRGAYPPRPDGRVLFPFRRLFVIASR